MAWAPEPLRSKTVDLATAHDVAETITGDSIPADGLTRAQKHVREKLAYEFLGSVDPNAAARLEELWQEYESNQTEAARLVHDVDKLQRLDKAFNYARKYPSLDLSDFKADADAIQHPKLRQEAEAVLAQWDQHVQGNKTYIFVTGGPGVGKGTQCEMAAGSLDALHVSVGDLLRDESKRPDSPFRDFINRSFEALEPVPPLLAMNLLRKVVAKSDATVVLLDGFPRSQQQLDFFRNEVSQTYGPIHLEARDATLEERLLGRGQTSTREDDRVGNVHRRVLASSGASSQSLIENLQQGPQKLYRVEAEGSAIEVQLKFLDSARAIIGPHKKTA